MAIYEFKPGAKFDMLTHAELKDGLTRHQKNWFAEMARGVKRFRFQPSTATVANSTVTLPPAGQTVGPRDGFVWAMQRITVAGLGSGDTPDVAKIYVNEATDMNFIGQVTGNDPTLFPGDKGFILLSGDTLIVTGSSLTATGAITVSGECDEVAAIDIWKIISGS